jgi:hypothetical protein
MDEEKKEEKKTVRPTARVHLPRLTTDRWTMVMGFVILMIGFTYLFLVTFVSLPTTGTDHSKTIVGFILGSVVSIIIGYYWGSSNGSAAKSQTIDKELGRTFEPK